MEPYSGQDEIMASIIIILLFVIVFMYLQKKYSKESSKKDISEELPPVEELKPKPLLIDCPACGTEISRQTPTCPKCGHPIYQAPNPNQTVIVQQSTRQSNGMGTAGFVLALISLFFSWLPGVGWTIWFLGCLLSFIGMFKSPRGLAITGFLISIIDLIILVAAVGAIASLFTAL